MSRQLKSKLHVFIASWVNFYKCIFTLGESFVSLNDLVFIHSFIILSILSPLLEKSFS